MAEPVLSPRALNRTLLDRQMLLERSLLSLTQVAEQMAVGYSRYFPADGQPVRTYHNAYLLRFAPDGRCAEFSEFYMLEGE